MKKVLQSNIIIYLLNSVIKYIVAILSNSYALFSEALFDVSVLFKYSSTNYNKDKTIFKRSYIYNVVIGGIIIMLGAIMVLNIFTSQVRKVKWFILLASIFCLIIRYLGVSLMFVLNYNNGRKEIVNLNRNYAVSMLLPWVVIVSYIISLFSKYLSILKYADKVGALFIACYIIGIGIIYIRNNFKGLGNEINAISNLDNYLSKSSISKILNNYKLVNYGASYKLILDVSFSSELQVINSYQMMLDLCNKFFKKFKNIEVISIIRTPYVEKKGMSRYARNSGSGNSKKNTKRKNTKKKY